MFCFGLVAEVGCFAREVVHPERDCVDDQLYFAQDMRQDMIVLSANVVRERVHVIIDRRNGQMLWVMRVELVCGSEVCNLSTDAG